MKKIISFVVIAVFVLSSAVYAGGGKVRGEKGTGPTGGTGSGQTTQQRG
jgi:hypothetical protein